ncbi:MAG: CPBP family intramembrane metalloprotease [Acidobacteriaceae bacterium]|nr:CPBP family intramembrane metalloprotease [Acidobacteriaceae bacterium]MBV9501578.1 CPBP family intramembrane metalloprotease [Acidobacteriaceae bacterium]
MAHSHWVMTAALPAFLIEAFFYLGSVFKEPRDWIGRVGPPRLRAALLWVSAVIPYCVFALTADTFQRNAFYLLAALSAILAFWYVLLPRRPAYDFGFLVIAAAPIIARVFPRIYVSPDPHLRVDVLGHLMWIRLAIAALFTFRHWNPGEFGFWPRYREWRTGLLWYAVSAIPIIAMALAIHDVHFEPLHGPWWRVAAIVIGTFFGVLWIVALSEELFFRGVIERGLLDSWKSPAVAIVISSLLFGVVHLWFHDYPDWRRAVTASLLGAACGFAYWQSGSVRSPMVTHAFVVATWRMFFK